MAIAPPNWKKDALPTARGWVHPRTGEILKSQKISQADIDDYLGIPEAPIMSVAEAQAMIDAQPASVTDPEMLVEEEASDYSNMTKLELEAHGRTMGIELDRRKSKADLINTLNEG